LPLISPRLLVQHEGHDPRARLVHVATVKPSKRGQATSSQRLKPEERRISRISVRPVTPGRRDSRSDILSTRRGASGGGLPARSESVAATIPLARGLEGTIQNVVRVGAQYLL
jgi:hypothetical protein